MSDESLTSRRNFFRTAGIGGLLGTPVVARAGHDGEYPTNNGKKTFDFTKKSGQLQPDKIIDSACQFCNSLCRLKVHVKDGRIIDVLGEEADPVQAGGLCVKGWDPLESTCRHASLSIL